MTTRQLLDQTLAEYYHEQRVWQYSRDLPWNRHQAKRVGILWTKCEQLRKQLDNEKVA